ncbi:MAG: hypothetical protein QM817_23375 [Archangium sp.]
MIPVGGIIAAVVIALRAINAAQNKSGESTPPTATTAAVAQTSRGSTSFWQDPSAAGTVVWSLILYGLATPLTIMSFEMGSPFMLVCGLSAWILLFPAWFARVVFAPLGMARLAYATAHLSRITWRRDKPGGPAMVAAWALVQQEKPWPSSLAWLDKKLAESKTALQASGVVARGLLEAAKGNRESARLWLDSVLLFDPRVAPRHVRVVAAEWLATDAASRGDWKRVDEIVAAKKWPVTRTLTLLASVSDRMLGKGTTTTAGLWLWWAVAPRRLWTWRFVRRAAAVRFASAQPEMALPEPPQQLEPMARATYLTLALKQGSAPSAHAVVEVARAWEAALAGDVRSKLFARSMLIGGGEPDEAIAEVRELIEGALAPLLPAKLNGVVGDVPALIDTAVQTRRDKLHNELEDKMSRMEQRKLANKPIPQLEEWHDFILLRALYRQAIDAAGSVGDYSLAHSIIRDKLVNVGVWLYNVRVEKPMGNAFFRLLETEAVVLGDADSEKLNKKNAACDL